jgi:hypothetical protein
LKNRSLFLSAITMCAALMGVTVMSTSITHCKGASLPTTGQIEAGAPLAASGCVVLEAFDSSGVLQAVCADLPLIEAVAVAVLPLFSVKKGEACTVLPANGACYTNTQRLAMIERIRARDGGK